MDGFHILNHLLKFWKCLSLTFTQRMLNANLEPDVYELLWLHVAPIASNLMCWLGYMQLCMQGSCD